MTLNFDYTQDEVVWDFSCAAIVGLRNAKNVDEALASARLFNVAEGIESK